MPNSVNNVKTEYTFETKKAQGAISSLISKLKEFQTLLNRDSGDKFGKSMQNSVKQSSSAIDSQVQKIANLKQSISEVKNQWKEASAIATEINKKLASLTRLAELGDAGKGGAYSSLLGVKAKEIESLYQQLDKLSMALSSATGSDLSRGQADVDAWVIKTTQDVKHEEEALRGMQREERKSASSAKSSTSAHKSFSQTLSKMSNVIKKIKSGLSSFVGNIKNIASSIKGAIPGANKFGGVLGKLASQFKRLFVLRILRNAISAMIKGFQEGIQNIAQYSAALNNLDANHANQTMSELASTALYLKNTLGSAAIPALNAILPVIRAIATGFATAVNYVNQFISALGGKSSWTRAKQVTVDYASSLSDVGSSAGSAKDAVDDLKRTILGFDEINKLNDANSSSGGSGGGSGGGGSDSVNVEDMFEEVPIDNKVTQWLSDLKPYIDDIKDAWGDVKTAVKGLVESEGFKYLVGTVFKEALLTIKDALLVISSIINSITSTLNDPTIKTKIDAVASAWDGVRASVKTLVESSAWNAVVNTLTFAGLTVLETVLNGISGLIDGIRIGLTWLEENGKISDLKDAIGGAGVAFTNLFNGEGFQDLTGTTLYLFVTGITGALNGIKTVIDTVVTPVLNELSRNGTFSQIRDDWDKIWKSVDNIAKSELFQSLVKFTLKSALEGVAGVLKTIAGFFETIDGIVNGDVNKIGQGWRDFVSGITGALQPVFEGIDLLFGTNLGAQNKILTKALSEGISYKEAEILLKDPSDRIVENDDGDMWAVEQQNGSYSTISIRNTIYKKLKEFQEEWASLPSSERSLAFDAFIDANAEQMAVIFKTEPWNELSQAEKQLAFDAYIATLPADLADEFARTHGTAPSWANLRDEEKALAWIAYISTSGKLIADKFTTNEWNKLSDDQKILAFKGWIESTGTTVANAFKTDQWKGLSDADKKLLFNAGIGNSGTELAKEYKDKKWATTSADDRSLYFNAGINTTGASVAKDFINVKWKGVSAKDKVLAFTASTSTSADTVAKNYKTNTWNKYTGSNKTLGFGASVTSTADAIAKAYKNNTWGKYTGSNKTLSFLGTIGTAASTMASNMSSSWNKLTSGKTLTFGGTFNGGSSSDSSSKTTLYGQWNRLKAFYNSNIPLYGWFSGGSSGDSTSKSTMHGQWNRLKSFFDDDILLYGWFKGGSGGDSSQASTMHGQWNRLKSFFSSDLSLFGWFKGGSQGDSKNTSSLWGQWNRLKDWFSTDLSLSAKITSVDDSLLGKISVHVSGSGGSYTKFTGGIIGKATGGLISAATGTFIDSAQLFMARENGIPEYVGRFGSQSAVANNYQITEGIAMGVERAVASQNELLREQNSLLAQIASNGGSTSVSSILGAIGRTNKRTGTPVVTMG